MSFDGYVTTVDENHLFTDVETLEVEDGYVWVHLEDGGVHGFRTDRVLGFGATVEQEATPEPTYRVFADKPGFGDRQWRVNLDTNKIQFRVDAGDSWDAWNRGIISDLSRLEEAVTDGAIVEITDSSQPDPSPYVFFESNLYQWRVNFQSLETEYRGRHGLGSIADTWRPLPDLSLEQLEQDAAAPGNSVRKVDTLSPQSQDG